MKWKEISNPPKNNSSDTLLWKGRFGRQDMMLRAFYDVGKDGKKCWMDEKGKKIPASVLKNYTHWLDINPPVFKRTIDLSGYKTKHKQGFTHSEIRDLLKKEYPSVKIRDFNKVFGIVTAQVVKGEVVYYGSDIELAIRCCLEKRGITSFEFD